MKKYVYIIGLILLLIGFMFMVNSVVAIDLYVNNNEIPSWYDSTHVKTIQEGIDNSSNGDTINIANSVYTITLANNVNKRVTLTGNITNPENVVVKFNPASTTLNGIEINSPDVTIRGIKVQDCKSGFHFNRNINSNTGVTISNCIIEGVSKWGVGEISSPNTIVSNNTIITTGDKGIYVRICIGTSELNRCEIVNNIISDCNQPAIQTYRGKYVYIYGNIINNTNDKGINIIGSCASSSSERIQVINNVISGTIWDGIQLCSSGNYYPTYVYVHGNILNNIHTTGISVRNTHATGINDKVEVSDNIISNTYYEGITVQYSSPYTYVFNNTLTGCNYFGGDGLGDWDYSSIHVEDTDGYGGSHHTVIDSNTISDGINGIQTWSNNVTITNNDIFNMGVTFANEKIVGDRIYKNSGILIGSNWGNGDIDVTGVIIENNNIHNNYWGLFYSSDLTNGVTANYNYWGHYMGCYHPTENPQGQGNRVSNNVLFDPWYIDIGLTNLYKPVRLTEHFTDPVKILLIGLISLFLILGLIMYTLKTFKEKTFKIETFFILFFAVIVIIIVMSFI